MKKHKVVLSFPETIVEEPVIYNLIADYGIRVNILRASINPGKQGRMVVEMSGEDTNMARGRAYLNRLKVQVAPLEKEIRRLEDRCTSCTACIPHCPTRALDVDRESWQVSFDAEKCVVCLSCLEVCIYGAMSMTEEIA